MNIQELTSNIPTDHYKTAAPRSFSVRTGMCTFTSAALASVILWQSSSALAATPGSETTKPWVVRTAGATMDGNVMFCTGVALNDQLVVTADHCPVSQILYPSGAVTVESSHSIDGSDIKILLLSSSYHLSEYPKLISKYNKYREGTMGQGFGYGANFPHTMWKVPLQLVAHEKYLTQDVHGTVKQSQNDYFEMIEKNGSLEPGDSGGPLIIGGLLVGIFGGKKQDVAMFNGIAPALSKIRELEHLRTMRSVDMDKSVIPWIGDVNVANGRFSATMGSELIHSGKNVFFWVNGKYYGNLQNDVSYYCSKTNITGGSIVSPTGRVSDGDLIQIGIDTGGGPHNAAAAEMLYEKHLNGVEAV